MLDPRDDEDSTFGRSFMFVIGCEMWVVVRCCTDDARVRGPDDGGVDRSQAPRGVGAWWYVWGGEAFH